MNPLLLPKVSVVIVNYNYSGYLEAAYDSVARQTYPNVEVVIVDDKSTDNSRETIDKICAKDDKVIAVKLDKNGGQSVASFNGFSASSGSYVLFLDADDQLLSDAVETHVYTHLSSRIHVAFTTADVINSARGQDVNMSHAGFATYVEGGTGLRPRAFRRIDESMPDSWFGQRKPPVSLDQLHIVLPPNVEPWVWSPTSANCYRRDAVALLLKQPGLERLRWGTDAFLIRALTSLFGSILIDRPLVRYVIHAENLFVKAAPLNQLHFSDMRSTRDDMRNMARTAVERLMADAAQEGARYAEPTAFFEAMHNLSESWPGPKDGEAPGDFYRQQLLANEQSLRAGFGDTVVSEVFRASFGLSERGKRLLRKANTR